MKKTAINAKQIRYSEFRIPRTQPPPQTRRKKEFTIIDEAELEEIRQAMIKLQRRVIELELEKEKEKLLKRNSPPQKRHSLPIQLQRKTPHPRQRNSLPTIKEDRRLSPPKLCRHCKNPNAKSGEQYCSDLCELGDVLGVPVANKGAK